MTMKQVTLVAITIALMTVSGQSALANSCPQGKMIWSLCMNADKSSYSTKPNSTERRAKCTIQRQNGCITG
jgi:hypothetical protein